MGKLNILFLTDLHYVGKAKHTCSIAIRKVQLAAQLLKDVLQTVPADTYDVIVLGGDLTDNGNAAGALEDLQELKQIITAQNKPVLIVRGNHDAPEEQFRSVFKQYMQPITTEGYYLLGFSDQYQPGIPGQRNIREMESAFATLQTELPVVLFQHSPIYPPIEDEYPYNLAEAERIMEFYQEHHVVLSVSGHLHRGEPDVVHGGIIYFTGAALCEAPFSYTILHLDGETVTCEQCCIEDKKAF